MYRTTNTKWLLSALAAAIGFAEPAPPALDRLPDIWPMLGERTVGKPLSYFGGAATREQQKKLARRRARQRVADASRKRNRPQKKSRRPHGTTEGERIAARKARRLAKMDPGPIADLIGPGGYVPGMTVHVDMARERDFTVYVDR